MATTTNYGLTKDLATEYYDVAKINANMDRIDTQMKLNADNPLTQDGKDNTVAFSAAITRANISTGEKLSILFGKIAKFFTDLHSSAFDGDAAKVNGKTVESNVPVNAVFTDTVYTHPTTVGSKHIPAGGSVNQVLKYSADGTAAWGADNDTIYAHPSSHPASMITGLPASLPADGGNSHTVDGYHITKQTTVPTSLAENVICLVYE